MPGAIELNLHPVLPPTYTTVSGPHWIITIGEPPRGLLVCPDMAVAERIHELLAEHGLLDVEGLITTTQGETE